MGLKEITNSIIVFHLIIFMISIIMVFQSNFMISSDANFAGYNFNFTASIATIIASIVITLIVLSLIGIQGLASGLNDTSTATIIRVVKGGALWAILSSLTFQTLISLGIFGIILYTIMTLIYAINLIGGSETD
jgi:hypothetical protein